MRILMISDIHGNFDAFETILEKEKYDAVWFLGDLTDYGPEPHLVLDALKDLKPDIWVSGNHDYANGYDVDCGCGEKTHELSVYTRENITKKLLDKEDIEFLKSIPLRKDINIEGKLYYFVHGCPADPLYGYMFDFMPECMHNELGGKITADYLFFGHTHFPVIGEYGGMVYANPGSVGQPRDGDWRAGYAIFHDGKVTLKRVEYPVENTISKIKNIVSNKKYREMLVSILKEGKV